MFLNSFIWVYFNDLNHNSVEVADVYGEHVQGVVVGGLDLHDVTFLLKIQLVKL